MYCYYPVGRRCSQWACLQAVPRQPEVKLLRALKTNHIFFTRARSFFVKSHTAYVWKPAKDFAWTRGCPRYMWCSTSSLFCTHLETFYAISGPIVYRLRLPQKGFNLSSPRCPSGANELMYCACSLDIEHICERVRENICPFSGTGHCRLEIIPTDSTSTAGSSYAYCIGNHLCSEILRSEKWKPILHI